MVLRSDFKGLRGSILHHSSLSSVDLIASKLLAEKICFQSYSKKEIISTSNTFMLLVPFKSFSNNHNKTYTRVAFNKYSLCKQKDHQKTQCSKLRQQNQAWKPDSQLQSNIHRPHQGYKPPHHNIVAVVSSSSFTDPSTLAEQFQKFLSLQSQAMFVSSFVGQLPHSSSGISYSEQVLDFGASHHRSQDSSSFAFVSHSFSIPVMIVDDTLMPLASVGSVVTPHFNFFFLLIFSLPP